MCFKLMAGETLVTRLSKAIVVTMFLVAQVPRPFNGQSGH